ncbi:MbtH family protein [Streptomyces stramineus]|uniref:MbtH family NRPS accessory protein n=1 Tax=Streptomyces stramineus TaxID=173861 RepID=A0ABN1AQ40_9ACTN
MTYAVVVNAEAQHSVWPEAKALPNGWERTGFTGSRDECLDHIARVWTDIRPRSVVDGAS